MDSIQEADSEMDSIQEADTAETNILLEDAIMTDAHPPPLPNLIDTNSRRPERQSIAFLCNPMEDHDVNSRRLHPEIFNYELNEVEKPALAEGCNCEWTLVTFIT
jgi:hypothetical protein